ncbi:endoplasmic reticulum-Golgi intermediate compartment protein 2-like [Symsagittifera roscoffensis]|uniref:endoplasmic reticulum-Golgi intermediate compartment protein 2-like n=1 Tax=Symsagittifera roscoffensis TaxID=84072 RepID=UPI00307B54E4
MEVRHRRPRKEPPVFSTAHNLIANLDAFPKIDSDFQTKSRSGGGLALLTFLFIAIMVVIELNYFLSTHIDYQYEVNFETAPKVELNIDITVATPCQMIDADVYDHISQTSFAGDAFPSEPAQFEMDETQAKYYDFLRRSRARMLNSSVSLEEIMFAQVERGKDFSSSITMSDLSEKKEEGEDFKACRFNGSILVNRHAGTLHIISGKQINLGIGGSFHAHIQMPGAGKYNFSHRIDHLSFGAVKVPMIGALDSELKITEHENQEYQYRMTVVPVGIETFKNKITTYRFSVTEKEKIIDHSHGTHGQSGIFFKYDFASLKIIAKEKRKPLVQFLVRIVGIIGGAFSLSSFFFFAYDFITCKGRVEES